MGSYGGGGSYVASRCLRITTITRAMWLTEEYVMSNQAHLVKAN